ncbi:MAG: hypothetical protein AAB304_10045, partial [Pseudomonadota bacterium]
VSTLRGVMLARRSKASLIMDWISLMVSAPDVQTVLFNKTCRKGAKAQRTQRKMVLCQQSDVLCVLCAFAADVYSVSR